MIGLLLAFACPARADRVVRVAVAADEEYRTHSDWRDRAEAALAEAGKAFGEFGIRFRIVEFLPFESSSPDHDVAALQNEMSTEVITSNSELIVGFAGATGGRGNRLVLRLGHSDTPGRHLLVSGRSGRDLPLVLRHELGHAFGLPHVSHATSVMNEGVESGRMRFDSLSAAMLRNNARLDFMANDPLARCNLGSLWALYDQVGRNGDDVADLIAIIGDSYRRRNEPDSARRAFQQAEQMSPGLQLARLGMAMLALADGRSSESISILESLRRDGADIPGLETGLGLAYAQLGLSASAIRAYETAIRQDPADVAALNNLGLLYQESGRSHDAEVVFKRALTTQPRLIQSWNNYGALLYKSGRHEEAIEAFQTSLDIEPHQSGADSLRQLIDRR